MSTDWSKWIEKCIKFGCIIIGMKIHLKKYIFIFLLELEFQQKSFLAYHFFITFTWKLTQVLILTLFFRILSDLTEKQKNAVRFSILKISLSIIFMHLRSKLISEICQKVGSLDKKTEQICLKVHALPPFSQKTTVFIEK